jgi:hypothetical protein
MDDGTPKISGPLINKKNTLEENGSQNDDLPNSLADNVFPHVWSNEVFESGVWFSLEKVFSWWFSSKSE